MKTTIFFTFFSVLLSSPSFAYLQKECLSLNQLKYTFNNRVGGVHPFPGMITNVEEIKIKDEVVYRRVSRESCFNEFCSPQQPELIDIIPDNFKFNFDEESKQILSKEGNMGSPIYKETFAIKFNLDQPVWMLCNYERLLLP